MVDSHTRFKHHANAMQNSIDRIKFDLSKMFKFRATAVPNSIHK